MRRTEELGQQIEAGGLAGAIGADQGVDGAAADVQGDAANGDKSSEFLRQILCFEDYVITHTRLIPPGGIVSALHRMSRACAAQFWVRSQSGADRGLAETVRRALASSVLGVAADLAGAQRAWIEPRFGAYPIKYVGQDAEAGGGKPDHGSADKEVNRPHHGLCVRNRIEASVMFTPTVT